LREKKETRKNRNYIEGNTGKKPTNIESLFHEGSIKYVHDRKSIEFGNDILYCRKENRNYTEWNT